MIFLRANSVVKLRNGFAVRSRIVRRTGWSRFNLAHVFLVLFLEKFGFLRSTVGRYGALIRRAWWTKIETTNDYLNITALGPPAVWLKNKANQFQQLEVPTKQNNVGRLYFMSRE